jgi:rhomboid protease GluP
MVVLYAAMLTQKETSTNVLAVFGGGVPPLVLERFGAWTIEGVMVRGEIWRLMTACLLHFDLLHLIFNALWLMQLGPMVEQVYGRSRFVVTTLVSGVVGMVLSATLRAMWGEMAIGAGASGMVFGLIGVALVGGYLKKRPGSEQLRAGAGKWALYAIIFSLLPGIDLVAHLGGGVTGAGLALVLADHCHARPLLPRRFWLALEVVCVLGLLLCLVAALLG